MTVGAGDNLIVEAVPPEQTAVATGMNTVMRTLGGACKPERSQAPAGGTRSRRAGAGR